MTNCSFVIVLKVSLYQSVTFPGLEIPSGQSPSIVHLCIFNTQPMFRTLKQLRKCVYNKPTQSDYLWTWHALPNTCWFAWLWLQDPAYMIIPPKSFPMALSLSNNTSKESCLPALYFKSIALSYIRFKYENNAIICLCFSSNLLIPS